MTRVEAIDSESTLREAAERMHERAVGSLVVVSEGRPVGVVTDRDLCVRALSRGLDADAVTVAEVMSTPLVESRPDDSPVVILERMRDHALRRMPLVEDGRLIGIIALDDLLAELLTECEDVAEEAREQFRSARRRARAEHLRDEFEELASDLRLRAQKANWTAREVFLDRLDALRERLRGFIED